MIGPLIVSFVLCLIYLNEVWAYKLIFEQECVSSNNYHHQSSSQNNVIGKSSSSKSCLHRVWNRYTDPLSYDDARKIHLDINKKELCSKVIRFGHKQDGGWNICVDDFPPATATRNPNHDKLNKNLRHSLDDEESNHMNTNELHGDDDGETNKDKNPIIATPCIVYSFGINDDPSFDLDLVSRWPHCTIYAFDPSIGRKTGDTFLGPNIKFYDIGLGGKDKSEKDDGRGWNMMTLDSIMKMLGHEHVNLLKMDIESSEWDTWESWKKTGVHKKIGQLLGEIHFSKINEIENVHQVEILEYLRDFGFHVFHRQNNFRYSIILEMRYSHDSSEMVKTYSCIEVGWRRSV